MSNTLFCNWEAETGEYDSGSLLEVTSLNRYDLLFFDPHIFALNNGFRESRSDLRLAEYKSFSESEFLAFLGKIKSITGQLHDFLDAGGVWVIRAAIPNSSIRIRKPSNAGAGKYTESIISFFFWLEEFLGNYSFQYSLGNGIRFYNSRTAIYQNLQECPVEYYQTQDRIPKGNIEIIAGTRGPTPIPALTRVSFGHNKGDIYFIPKFMVKDEYTRLIKAFGQIVWEKKYGPYKPKWIQEYDRNLTRINPHIPQIEQLEKEISRLNETKTVLEIKRDHIQSLSDLLYKTGDDLLDAVKKALSLIGFTFPSPPIAVTKARFDFYARDNDARQIVGHVAASDDHPLVMEEFERFRNKIIHCDLMDKPKGLIIANAAHNLPLDERPPCFADEVIDEASHGEYCLMSTIDLFHVVCYLLGKSDFSGIDLIKRSLQKDILGRTGLYKIDRRKYLAPTA